MSDDYVAVAATPLKRWRASLGLTQQAAAGALGYNSLRAYQQAETKPEVYTILRLAMAAVSAGIAPYSDEKQPISNAE
jgi:transcriptional regulator with XRE-family HTH domain